MSAALCGNIFSERIEQRHHEYSHRSSSEGGQNDQASEVGCRGCRTAGSRRKFAMNVHHPRTEKDNTCDRRSGASFDHVGLRNDEQQAAAEAHAGLQTALPTVKAVPDPFQPTGKNRRVNPREGRSIPRTCESDARSSAPELKHVPAIRISWIDIARGIALIFIIMSDIAAYFAGEGWGAGILGFCGAFAFPLLFMVCGYTTNKDDFSLYRIARLARRYLVPYCVAAVIVILTSCMISQQWDVVSWAASFVYAMGGERGVPLGSDLLPVRLRDIGVLWLLPALFIARTGAYLLAYVPMITRLIVSGGIFILCAGTSGGTYLPLAIQPAGCALWFITFGMMCREQYVFSREGWERTLIAICATFGVAYIVVLSGQWLAVPEYGIAFYHQPPVDMAGGVCAALLVMGFSQIAGELTGVLENVLEWVGRNVVPIYCWHAVVLVFVPLLMEASSIASLAAMPGVAVFAIMLVCAYALAFLLALVSYKVPFLHWIFCSSSSSSASLVAEAKASREKMSVISEVDID